MRYFTLFFLILTSTYATGQGILFNKIYTKPSGGMGSAVIERYDGKYLIAATTENLIELYSDINLLLVDSAGNLIWDKVIEKAESYEVANSLIETSDLSYLISGVLWFENFPYLILLDADGNSVWEKQYPQALLGEGAFSVGETEDGNYFFVESSQPYFFQADLTTTLHNVSSTGEINWTKEYDFANCGSVIRTSDNGYALTGLTYDSLVDTFNINSDIILIKANSSGDTLWTRKYEVEAYSSANSIQQTQDEGYIIAGFNENPNPDYESPRPILIKTDAYGDTLWTKKYDLLGSPCYIASCEFSSGYIMSSSRKIEGPFLQPDTFLIAITKLDLEGDILWSRQFDGYIYNFGNNITETSDGGFLLAGTSGDLSYSPGNVVLIKLDSIGDFVISTNFPTVDKSAHLSVYPNPASEFITFKLNENDKGIREISIFNINGQKVKEIHNQITNQVEIEINNFSNGIYFYEIISSEKERFAGKFVVNK